MLRYSSSTLRSFSTAVSVRVESAREEEAASILWAEVRAMVAVRRDIMFGGRLCDLVYCELMRRCVELLRVWFYATTTSRSCALQPCHLHAAPRIPIGGVLTGWSSQNADVSSRVDVVQSGRKANFFEKLHCILSKTREGATQS